MCRGCSDGSGEAARPGDGAAAEGRGRPGREGLARQDRPRLPHRRQTVQPPAGPEVPAAAGQARRGAGAGDRGAAAAGARCARKHTPQISEIFYTLPSVCTGACPVAAVDAPYSISSLLCRVIAQAYAGDQVGGWPVLRGRGADYFAAALPLRQRSLEPRRGW